MNTCARSHREDSPLEITRVLNRYTVHRRDYIAGMDFPLRCRTARLRLLKNRTMRHGHAETHSERFGHWSDLRANPSTPRVGLRVVNEAERCRNENANERPYPRHHNIDLRGEIELETAQHEIAIDGSLLIPPGSERPESRVLSPRCFIAPHIFIHVCPKGG